MKRLYDERGMHYDVDERHLMNIPDCSGPIPKHIRIWGSFTQYLFITLIIAFAIWLFFGIVLKIRLNLAIIAVVCVVINFIRNIRRRKKHGL